MISTATPPKIGNTAPAGKHYFAQTLGIGDVLLQRCLGAALSRGGDFAELYFESSSSTGIAVDEGIVKSASQSHSMGCGIRVLSGERTGYSYTDELTEEKLLHAARTAALIADGPSTVTVQPFVTASAHTLYPVALTDVSIAARLALVQRADRAARAADPRITQVRAGFNDEIRHILVVASDGTYAADTQPLSRFSVGVLAKDPAADGGKGASARGSSGGGGRVELSFYETDKTPEYFAKEAVRTALVQLTAQAAPAGEMEVVLGPGWPGVLIHEAVGHGLEADFNRKKQSAFAGLMGQRVATEKVTVVDNGTIPNRRGSLNIDDEGLRHAEHNPHRQGRAAQLPERQTVRKADGPAEHRQRAARELRVHPHAPHDEHLHACRRGRAGRHSAQRKERHLRCQFLRRLGRHHQRQVRLRRKRSVPD